ncbi:MAG: alpha/beta hydrolase [Candidatus Saccharibacteria bacterium]|nr:alpha/beta hydrolase [Moraxellaceae bacterium]
MTGIINNLKTRAEKLQGSAARLTMRLPPVGQRALAKVLGFDDQFSKLDSHLQVLIAIRNRMAGGALIGPNPEKSRKHFRKEMASIIDQPTTVERISNLEISVRSGNISARHYIPRVFGQNNKPLPLLVFFHGGGFVVGDLDTHDEPCRLLCQHAQVQVLSVAYRLAPEQSAPAASNDCLDALKWAHKNAAALGVDPTKIAVGGDSAGGNLSAVVSQLAAGKPYAPAAQLLIYPVVDLDGTYPSHRAYGKGLFLNQTDMDNAKLAYVSDGKLKLTDPRVSPLFGKLEGLAPALLVTAELDTLRDEGETYAVKLRESGTPCDAYRVEGQGHGFINITPINRAAYDATIKIAHNFRVLLDRS